MTDEQGRLRAQHQLDAIVLDDDDYDRKWSRLNDEGLDMLFMIKNDQHKFKSTRLTQRFVLEAIKAYCEAGLNLNTGALWDAIPGAWHELYRDLELWITNYTEVEQ